MPDFARLIGIETRPRVASIAREALGDEAEILTLDARGAEMPRADVVLLFDVLHLMSAADQESLLASLVRTLEPGGAIVIREADASAGWRFATVRLGNRLKALAIGRWRQTFHFRSAAGWLACFERLGLRAELRPMGKGTPFGNVLFRVERR
jgi:SAM-dependent methyltransferase